jgi:long-subunit acyl-CoA synthetase (AMP-forming)
MSQEVERNAAIQVENSLGTLFLTSGTTGVQKRFYLSDQQLAARVARRVLKPGLGKVRSLICLLNPISTAGKTYQLWCQHNGVTFVHLMGSTPVMQFAEKNGIDGLVGNPQQLLRLANYTGTFRFKWLMASGATVSQFESKLFRQRLGEPFHASYGASEVGTIAVATSMQLETIPYCLGTPCRGTVVRIDQNGWLAVKTPTMFSGYINPDDTRFNFIDGWFYPGDRAKMVQDMLIWTGTKRR